MAICPWGQHFMRRNAINRKLHHSVLKVVPKVKSPLVGVKCKGNTKAMYIHLRHDMFGTLMIFLNLFFSGTSFIAFSRDLYRELVASSKKPYV